MIAKEQGLVGIGLRPPHFQHVLETSTQVSWFEVHSENFLFHNNKLNTLLNVREKYPISLHGIGLSLGSTHGLEKLHLDRLKELINRVDPFLISEHLSWNKTQSSFLPDLLPIPYNATNFAIFKNNLEHAQEYLKHHILIENPSSYFEYEDSTLSEVEFLVTLCKSTGAKILLDVNNVFVSCSNHQWDPIKYISSIPSNLVAEIHLAGHSIKQLPDKTRIKIDTHDRKISKEVWALFQFAIKHIKNCPTLIEWDAKIPSFSVLEKEALKASKYLNA